MEIENELENPDAFTWRPLRIFNYYRLILAGFFYALTWRELPPPLGIVDARLFEGASFFYAFFALTSLITIRQKSPRFHVQLFSQVMIDIFALTLLTHASGGINSGLGMLQIITVAIGGMIARGRIVLLYAAIASIAVLFGQTYTSLTIPDTEFSYPQAGILGITLFTTAFVARVLAKRARESEALAKQRGVDLANMAQLTEYVIEHMQTGIVVVNGKGVVRMMNRAARYALSPTGRNIEQPLTRMSPSLAGALFRWQDGSLGSDVLVFRDGELEVLPQFMPVGKETDQGTLIFLEDATRANREAQQIKLASLGRLTASIAHEVRNPLGAISHAGQLLAESPDIHSADRRLLQIIQDQSKRVNVIIENVLALGRSGRSQPIMMELLPWLEQFLQDFYIANAIDQPNIALICDDREIEVRMDPSHLHQILWNLCRNGLLHGGDSGREFKVELRCGKNPTGRPYLDVVDFGPGISEDNRGRIFEPFFTTHSKGTGLGLYLSRELAEANHGRLDYLATEGVGGHFRLSFSDPNRMME